MDELLLLVARHNLYRYLIFELEKYAVPKKIASMSLTLLTNTPAKNQELLTKERSYRELVSYYTMLVTLHYLSSSAMQPLGN